VDLIVQATRGRAVTVFQMWGCSTVGPHDDVRPEPKFAGDPDVAALEQRLAAGAPERVGWFRYFFDDQRWEWSPQVQRMHGYQPGTVTPTTELVLAHKHRDDVRHITDTLALIRQTRQPFSSRHRICDTTGGIHWVIVVGDELHDEVGAIVGTYGFYIDVTPEELVRQDLARVSEDRGVIEQAKGMLMLIYGYDALHTFELLRWQSQHTNIALHRLAEQITVDFTALTDDEMLPTRTMYDTLLLNIHTRTTPNPEEALHDAY
jgi:PAS domain S-box-containing protein